MPVNFGSDSIFEIYYGTDRISQAYYGADLVYDRPYVKIKFYFDRTNVNPRGKYCTRAQQCGAEWLSSTDDPHIWYVITPLYDKGAGTHDAPLGIAKLFCSGSTENGALTQSAVGTCQVMEITGDVDRIETLDRLFQGCTAITSISTSGFYSKFANSTVLINVNSISNGDTGITDGSSLAGYNILKDVASITTHASTFTNADSAANLAQIPVGWGGTQIPASVPMSSNRGQWKASSNNYDVWTITADGPDWTDMMGVYLLTTASVSSFAGVSMNRSRISKFNRLVTSGAELYFYPCFMQHSSSAVTWAVMTQSHNGMLTAQQGNTDMPGTLDYTSYGPFAHEYGTYDSSQDVYFCFFVTNVDIDSWGGFTDKYGILWNSNFKADAGLRWFKM